MEVTASAQHQAWRSPHNPLRCASVHAFGPDGGGRGPFDAGWGSEEGWTALTAGPAPLTRSRPWEQDQRRVRILAVTGTDAHLRLLAGRGLGVGDGEPVPAWTLAVR